MNSIRSSRRAFTAALVALPAINTAASAATDTDNGLIHSAEAIHDEVTINASRSRVYAALTDAKQFDGVTRLSDAINLVTAPNASATAISTEIGGAFTLFGGYITGRQIELVRDQRLVQVWRSASWGPGDFSIVRFVLADAGAGTQVILDHRGFPPGRGADLASGWYSHYWEPLRKFLAQ
ncbi:MAG TPA: SRPBCC domain-containing protein [Steroidobacteraceae bacterium]